MPPPAPWTGTCQVNHATAPELGRLLTSLGSWLESCPDTTAAAASQIATLRAELSAEKAARARAEATISHLKQKNSQLRQLMKSFKSMLQQLQADADVLSTQPDDIGATADSDEFAGASKASPLPASAAAAVPAADTTAHVSGTAESAVYGTGRSSPPHDEHQQQAEVEAGVVGDAMDQAAGHDSSDAVASPAPGEHDIDSSDIKEDGADAASADRAQPTDAPPTPQPAAAIPAASAVAAPAAPTAAIAGEPTGLALPIAMPAAAANADVQATPPMPGELGEVDPAAETAAPDMLNDGPTRSGTLPELAAALQAMDTPDSPRLAPVPCLVHMPSGKALPLDLSSGPVQVGRAWLSYAGLMHSQLTTVSRYHAVVTDRRENSIMVQCDSRNAMFVSPANQAHRLCCIRTPAGGTAEVQDPPGDAFDELCLAGRVELQASMCNYESSQNSFAASSMSNIAQRVSRGQTVELQPGDFLLLQCLHAVMFRLMWLTPDQIAAHMPNASGAASTSRPAAITPSPGQKRQARTFNSVPDLGQSKAVRIE